MNWFFGLAAGEFSVLFFGLLVKGVLADAYGIGTAPKISVHPGGEKDDPITHQGETLGYLLEGEIELDIDGTTYHVKAGDSFFFKAHLTNAYRNKSDTVARIIWVNTPQIH